MGYTPHLANCRVCGGEYTKVASRNVYCREACRGKWNRMVIGKNYKLWQDYVVDKVE